MESECPNCHSTSKGVFPVRCPNCDFNIDGLVGRSTSSFQEKKWKEHTQLLYGDTIDLHEKEFNASFDYKGIAHIDELIRFTITFGDKATILDARGIHSNQIILSYFPEPIGRGTAIHYHQLVPCSGLMVISPQSEEYAHAFPVLDEWVHDKFQNGKSHCRLCKRETDFGQPICSDCYTRRSMDWEALMLEF